MVFNRRLDLESDNTEFLAIDIHLPKKELVIVHRKLYSKQEEQLLNSPHYVHQETYLLGNFNRDISTKNNNSRRKSLNSFLRTFSFTQIISCHIRITSISASILDLILVSDVDNISQSGVTQCSFSDHDVIFCTRKVNRGYLKTHNVTKIRCMKNYSKENFLSRLELLDWSSVLEKTDVTEVAGTFSSTVQGEM